MQDTHALINEALQSVQNQEDLPKFELLSHDDLLNLNIPPMQWVMNMVIPHPGLVVLSGKPGSYKTFFALWIGMRASAGLPLFDANECDSPFFCSPTSEQPMGRIPTLMVEEENSKQLMKERARGFRPIEIGEMYYLINNSFKFTDPNRRNELRRIIDEKGIKLLILDPFSSVMGLDDENSNSEVSKIMDIVRKEFVEQGMSVVLIHHPSKGDGTGKSIRGAGDILGKCDVHLCLEIDEKNIDEIKLTYEKLRVADLRKVENFRISLVGECDFRDQRFKYVGVAKKKSEEKREELANEILLAMDDGEERNQKEIAEMVDQKPNNEKFRSAWKFLLDGKRILLNATSKKFHTDISKLKTTPF